MRILEKFIIKGFLRFFLLSWPSLISIYLIVEIFEKIDDFIENNVSILDTFSYFLFKVPQISFELFPVAILIAGLSHFAILIKHKEYTALRAVGIAPNGIILIPVALSSCLAFFMVIFHGTIVERANQIENLIYNQYLKKDKNNASIFGSRSGKLFFRGKNSIWQFTPAKNGNEIKDVTLILFDNGYLCEKIIRAGYGQFSEKGWVFKNAAVGNCSIINKVFLTDKSGDSIDALLGGRGAELIDSLSMEYIPPLKDTPHDFRRIGIEPRFAGIFTLFKTMLYLRSIGIKNSELEGILWSRLFYPFFGVSILFFGLKAITFKEGGGLGGGTLIGLALSFSGWALWNLFIGLGETGKIVSFLPPVILIASFIGLGIWIDFYGNSYANKIR